MKDSELYDIIKIIVEAGGINNKNFTMAINVYKELHPMKYAKMCKACRGKALAEINADFKTFLALNKMKYETK